MRSVAHTVCVGRDDAEVARRADAIGRTVADMPGTRLVGTAAEVVDAIGDVARATGVTRVYLQLMDLSDLDHLELIAAEVAPQLA